MVQICASMSANLFTLKKRVLMKQKHRKLKVLGYVLSSALLAACNRATSTSGDQDIVGPLSRPIPTVL